MHVRESTLGVFMALVGVWVSDLFEFEWPKVWVSGHLSAARSLTQTHALYNTPHHTGETLWERVFVLSMRARLREIRNRLFEYCLS